jgi:hypothetical protein
MMPASRRSDGCDLPRPIRPWKNIISISCAAKVELAVPACGGVSADKIQPSFGHCDPTATINHKPREDALTS